jgi:putative DNA primase/helicase
MASFYCDLPLGIDEKQVAGDKQGFIESIVYLLGLGKGKTRGAKGNGLQAFQSWRTVVITTGEEPLSSSSSTGGVKTRTMEIYGQPIPDKQVAADVYAWTQKSHGTAGVTWINKVIDAMAKEPNLFIDDYKTFMDKLAGEHEENIKSHMAALSLICVADYYASQWIFGLDQDAAYTQAVVLAEHVIGLLETAAESDDANRAYEYFISWVTANNDSFYHDYPNTDDECAARYFNGKIYYGFIRDKNVFVLPHIFDQAMKQGGFNCVRVMKDWKEKGWLVTGNSDDKKRLKIRQYDPYSKNKLYFIGIQKN